MGVSIILEIILAAAYFGKNLKIAGMRHIKSGFYAFQMRPQKRVGGFFIAQKRRNGGLIICARFENRFSS
jgi:hypothetical protein